MPKKRKPKSKPTQKQKQSQKQSVVVNIGSKPRKSSGKGRLPPPSHMHNLAPTFITAPQVDYTPLLAMMQHNANRLVAQEPIPITQTPLSSTLIASNAEKMAGEAAIRRAGPTADNFQPLPSVADERRAMGQEDKPLPKKKKTKLVRTDTEGVRPPDPVYSKTLQDLSPDIAVEAKVTPKRGRPRTKGVQTAEPVRTGSVISRMPKQDL